MILRRILGWSMMDMTYMKLNQTKAGLRRWDGKPLADPPSFDDLPEKARRRGCQGVLTQASASSVSTNEKPSGSFLVEFDPADFVVVRDKPR